MSETCNQPMSQWNPGTGAIYCNEPAGHEGQHRHTFVYEIPANHGVAELLTRELLAAYRRKRASGGGTGRCYDAREHYDAEQEIERIEKLLAGSEDGKAAPTSEILG